MKIKNVRFMAILFFLFCTQANAIQLQFKDSKILALWSFVLGATSSPIGSVASVDFYKKSNAHCKSTDDLLDEAAKIIESNLKQEFSYDQPIFGRGEQGWDAQKHFLLQAAVAKTLLDFKLHTSDILPYQKHKRLFEILNSLMPVYEKVIWNPNRAKLSKIKRLLGTDFKKLERDHTFEKAIHFYRSEIEPNTIFNVNLIPIPGEHGGTMATVVSNEIFTQVLVDGPQSDIHSNAGVMVHETAHYIYETQSKAVQEELLSWFNLKNSMYGKFLYESWDEILATVIGNGYGFEVVSGLEDKTEWYQNHEYETIARAIYPLLKDYFKQNKAIDRAFVDHAIQRFSTLLPDAEHAFFRMFKSVFIVINEDIDASNLKKPFKRIFKYRGETEQLSRTQSILSNLKRGYPEGYAEETYRSVIIASENLSKNEDIKKLDLPRELMNRLKEIKSNKPGYISYLGKNSLPIILIQGKTESDFTHIARVLRKKYSITDEVNFREVYE